MKNVYIWTVLLCLWIFHSDSQALTIGQKDDFQDANAGTMGWTGNSNPTRITTGGPEGAGDAYLQINSSFFHLATKNESTWTGDFTTAGVQAIEMDLNRTAGPDDVQIRIFVHGPGGRFGTTNPTVPIVLGVWEHYVFDLTSTNMTYVSGGTGVLEDTLKNVTKLLIRNDPTPTPSDTGSHFPHITATLGIDNIASKCLFAPVSDINGDCLTNFLDVAEMANDWLLDCNITPNDPRCLPK